MLNRKMNRAFLLAMAVLLVVASICLAAQKVEDTFDIDYRAKFKKSIKPPVTLTHAKHSAEYEIACDECHHVYEDGKNVWKEGMEVQQCIECHLTDRKEAKKLEVLDFKKALHKNCQTCHKKELKEGKKDAPVKCKQCHVKK